MHRLHFLAAGAALLVGGSAANAGGILYVDDDAPLGGDGARWGTAYRYLQDALSYAALRPVTEIRIAQGVYSPDKFESDLLIEPRAASFHVPEGVTLLGGYAGIMAPDTDDVRDVDVFLTLLTGDINRDDRPGFVDREDNSWHVITVDIAVPPQLVTGTTNLDGAVDPIGIAFLDGITVAGGHAAHPTWDDGKKGGGLLLRSGTVHLRDVRFLDNRARMAGGAIFASEGTRLVIEDSLFSGNLAAPANDVTPDPPGNQFGSVVPDLPLFIAGTGGAIDGDMATIVLIDTALVHNTAAGLGGAIHVNGGLLRLDAGFLASNEAIRGGAIQVARSRLHVIGSEFTLNEAIFGGAIEIVESDPSLVNCWLTQNRATGSGGALHALHQGDSRHAGLVNCVLAGNWAGVEGGAITSMTVALEIASCSMFGNDAPIGATMCARHGGLAQVDSSIMWDCKQPIEHDAMSSVLVTNSDIAGGWPGSGNINEDPQCVDPLNGDMSLTPDSPCVDTGATWALPLDIDDLDEDGDVGEPIPFDILGYARLVDGNADCVTDVDMGAFEHRPALWADFDGDGEVGGSDLGILLAAWGTCDGRPDLTGDGVVDGADVGLLLGSWGAGIEAP